MIAKLMSMYCTIKQGPNTNPYKIGSNNKKWTAAKATWWLNTFTAKRDCSRIYRSLPNATSVEI